MRPKKTRWVNSLPGERCFKPLCRPLRELKKVNLTLDEFEAIHLCDLKRFEQEGIARRMKVSRSTVSRILSSARRKIADALFNIKAISIEGGCCQVVGKRK